MTSTHDDFTVPAVSIIIPTFQGSSFLRATLTALRSQAYASAVEIIAVDSGSTDGTLDILQEFGVHLLEIPPQKFSHGYARNLGARMASHPILVFMSQDALPIGTDWLRGMVASVEDPQVAAAYVRQLPRPDATPLEAFAQNFMYPAESKHYAVQVGEPLPLERIFFSNVCSVTRRDIAMAFPFNETLIMSEDQAFAKDLLLAGYTTYYNADVCVIHSHQYSLPKLFCRNFDSAYSLHNVTDDGWQGIASRGLQYIINEVRYLLREREWQWLCYVPVYEAARILGRLCGGHAHLLSRSWLPSFSLNRAYWARESLNY
jgi:rhamnosyltransferase